MMEDVYRRNPMNPFFLLGDSGMIPIFPNLLVSLCYAVLFKTNNLISGYPLRPWLLTPLREVQPNSPEERFNNRLKSARSLIERCNGVLKNRFRCLLKHRVLHYSPHKAGLIINACVCLHNMCIDSNVPEAPPEEDIEIDYGVINVIHEDNVLNHVNVDLENGRRLQRNIIRNHFN